MLDLKYIVLKSNSIHMAASYLGPLIRVGPWIILGKSEIFSTEMEVLFPNDYTWLRLDFNFPKNPVLGPNLGSKF